MLFRSEYEVTFDSTGKVLKLKAKISAKELNGAIKSTLRKEFSDCIISEVEMVEENGVKIYEIELKSIFQEWDVVLNEEGQILKRKED